MQWTLSKATRRLGLSLAVVLILWISLSLPVYGQTNIDLRVNGNLMMTPVEPYIKNGSTMIPLRAVCEILGAQEVTWVAEEKLAIISYLEKIIVFQIGNATYYVDGEERTLNTAPEIMDSRTMVPLRAAAEAMDFQLNWQDLYDTVEIIKEGATLNTDFIAPFQYTYDDVLWLARIVTVEGRGISYEAKLGIANVVLNRVKSPLFPSSVYSVIFDKAYAIQFPPAHKDGFSDLVPTVDSLVAAKTALSGDNNVDTCLYFNNRPFRSKADDLFAIIDGEYFYK